MTRSDKTSLIAQKHTCSLNLVYLLLHLSSSDSVSFIRIASDLFTSEQNFIWILALQTTLWNFKHVKLGEILMGYKTGFVKPSHIFYMLYSSNIVWHSIPYLLSACIVINVFRNICVTTRADADWRAVFVTTQPAVAISSRDSKTMHTTLNNDQF